MKKINVKVKKDGKDYFISVEDEWSAQDLAITKAELKEIVRLAEKILKK